MTRGSSSSSSQVGLFSTQISEQIVRLRALAKSQDGPSEAHQVDLRRAVMATRLLAGSARILQLDPLQVFLDELLGWLQAVQGGGRALNTTQALILDSVVEIEESLMLHLDEVEDELGADLEAFEPQLHDLLTLIRHNLAKSGPVRSEEPLDPASIDRSAGTPSAALTGPEALDAAARWFEGALDSAPNGEDRAAVLSALRESLTRLVALSETPPEREDDTSATDVPPEPLSSAEGFHVVEDPDADPVFGAAVQRLREQAAALGIPLHLHVLGGGQILDDTLRPSVSRLLVDLSEDILASLRHGRREGDRAALRVSFTLAASDGRALITVADDAPRVHGSPLLGDADHLALMGGMRRARALLEQTQGLIRVEPESTPEQRFVLSVPLGLDRPRYAILDLDQARVAVPAALLDEVIDASGLLYDTDESGESVDHAGHSVPIADLAQFVAAVVPPAHNSPFIAVMGSVEKRVGVGCEGDPVVIETGELFDPPEGWESIAYAALEIDDELIPVLDPRRVLALRFRMADEHGLSGSLSGSHADPLRGSAVDAFVAEADEATAETALDAGEPAAAAKSRELRNALLVNQSEFRRRDLSRTLEKLGFEVTVHDDLTAAARRIEIGTVDLLVTDLRLGQDGGESFHSLRKKYPDLLILLTSSVAKQYAKELAEKTGAHRCWLDPYRTSDLRELLQQILAPHE